jgi:uncharacterized peroxidase-related enzyme
MNSTALTHPTASDMHSPHASLRLSALDAQPGILLRLFNWIFRARFGKSMTPSRVIYARFPTLLWRQLPLYHLVDSGLSIDPGLRHLIEVQVSTLNGCTFCADLHRANAHLIKVQRDKLAALADYETNAVLSERERAAVRYVSEIAREGTVQDETFEALRARFTEREIVEITWLQAFTTYLNRMAVPLGIGSDGFCELLSAKTAPAISHGRW